LDKELRLRPQGIKVLSLFFIDSVEKYRQYTSDGHAMKGSYAKIFEDELRKACATEKYKPLFASLDLDHDISAMHDGYFSIDKKGGWTNTAENNAGGRENAERAYNLIMKDKEKLLAMRTPLKFIFSHSALKEGWDNPNVFQICNLRDMSSERERRQTIGRGLRLCVNQEGVRVRDERINTLTVIATESYESFAENLQKEIIAETGIRFGYVEVSQLAAITTKDDDGKLVALGSNASKLYQHLKQEGYLSASGEVQDALRKVLKDNTLQLPEQFAGLQPQIIELLKKVAGKLEVKDANERQKVKLRKDDNGKSIVLSDDFKALWDRIKHKTVYQVEFDNQKLIQDCIRAINSMPAIAKTRLQWRKADVSIGLSGVSAKQKNEGAQTLAISEADIEIPDVLTELQDRTQLTRRTLVNILTTSSRLEELSKNPQQFIKNAGEALERAKRKVLVEGIKYQRLGEQHVYAQELFEDSDGYLKNIFQNARKAIYENVIYDSEIERQFTQDLEANDQVKMYVKLPSWFEVPTPLGSYNPDWAILLEDKDDGQERLYFVVETKGSLLLDDLRNAEAAKIKCGKEHFKAIADANERPAKYIQANSVDSFFNQAEVLG
ncbi:MAG: restriction endonuclease subunit R, partial [Lactococcus garvieae]